MNVILQFDTTPRFSDKWRVRKVSSLSAAQKNFGEILENTEYYMLMLRQVFIKVI